MNLVRKYFLPFLLIVVALSLLRKCNNLSSLKNLFAEKPVVIDETPILIREIKSIGQLITYTASDEVVVDSAVPSRAATWGNTINHISIIPVLPSLEKRLVLIGKGKVLAGVDLTKLSDSSVHITSDTVTIVMPPAQILDAILNPSDFETFVEKGNWTNDEVILVKTRARAKIIDRAATSKVVEKAGARAKVILESFLNNMGYKNVLIR